MFFKFYFRSVVRTIAVLVVLVVSYGGVGLLADFTVDAVHAEEAVFDVIAFEHPFSSQGTLREAGSPTESSSPYFWLLSGGKLIQEGGSGLTLQGELSVTDPYAVLYKKNASIVTDGGVHPQNAFRLLTRTLWENVRQEITVTINDHNLATVKNRQAWNGIDLIARYKDDNNFYYGTVRMDGKVTLKKRVQGINYTLADVPYFTGTYDVTNNPSLLPEHATMRFALETFTNTNGSVTVRMYGATTATGNWTLIAQKTDTSSVLLGKGRSGFYSDFMDVSYDNYRLLTRSDPYVVTPVPVYSAPYGLATALVLQETSTPTTSGSQDWWLNSGAYFKVENNVGKTNQGALPLTDPWRVLYAASNARDTDQGYHPQNIFRLLTKSTFKNVEQKAYFNIRAYHLSDSPLRAEHNALLFFNRYKDSDDLYYTGLRVDGTVIVKKKLAGAYYTLASKKVLSGTYNRTSNPNLIPIAQWLGLKSITENLQDGSVRIRVYTDLLNTGVWTLAVEVIDGGSVIDAKASGGVRTDYMDVWFKDYSIREI